MWQALNKCLLVDSFLHLHPFDSSDFELSISEKAMPWASKGLSEQGDHLGDIV